MAPQFNIDSNIPITSPCYTCYTPSFNPNPTPLPTATHIQRPRPAPKERKNLINDELALYPIVPVTEKMLESDNGVRRRSTIMSRKSKHIVDTPNDDNDDGRPKMLKSASNVISNTFTQVKSGIFGSILNLSSTAESNQDEKSDSNECLICFEFFIVGDNIRLIPCLHRFHQECLDTWLTSRSGSCPNCRYDLRPQQENPIHEDSVQDTALPANPSLQPVVLATSTNRQQQLATQDQSSFFLASAATNNSL
ncbi:RING-H2 finger protein ATL72 [Smittium culicis]|uniref:RING-H2 finger protein ATL72 n=1 Tax=Smittium culicis TaxID=133412 RepID=A0A1R1XI43_9FUNG|nr:RING-H2 finger protein ATL72 [Smittium culicis]